LGDWIATCFRRKATNHHIWRPFLVPTTCERSGCAGVHKVFVRPLGTQRAQRGAAAVNFNNWDGRHHPMQQRLGGIWELFIPAGGGHVYK